MSRYVVDTFFSEEECNLILEELQGDSDFFRVTDEFGVLDLSVYEMPVSDMVESPIKNLINSRIGTLKNKFGISPREGFFIKYCDDKVKMDPHYDGGTSTTLIYLNNDFVGGGTKFVFTGEVHNPQDYEPGHMIHYKSNSLASYHTGLTVEEGTKWVLVVKSLELNLLSIFTLIPYRLFRDIFLERFLFGKVFKKYINVDNR